MLATVIGLFFVVGVAAGQSEPEPAQPMIVGGEEAAPGAWPWQVAIVKQGFDYYNGQYCGGSLIKADWVLTAAHCVENSLASDLFIVAGIHNLVEPEPDVAPIDIAEIIIHPGWNTNTNDNDIALLKLAAPAPIRAANLPVLPIRAVDPVPSGVGTLTGVVATVTGWGNRQPGSSDYPATLHQVSVPIISNDVCNLAYFGEITAGMLCAGLPEGGKDSCQGDSGGPLVIYDEVTSSWKLAGIVSWGIGCALPGLPGVYTRVSSYVEWIQEVAETPISNPFGLFLPSVLR